MTNTQRALQGFWGGFQLPAYPEENVPSDAELPYITYTVVQPDWRDSALHQVRVWYRGEGYADISAKVDEIQRAVGDGKLLHTSAGFVCLRPDGLQAQYQPIDTPDIKVAYLNFQLNSYQTEG